MKTPLPLVLLFCICVSATARSPVEPVIVKSLTSKNLANEFGEDPAREIAVYLPDG